MDEGTYEALRAIENQIRVRMERRLEARLDPVGALVRLGFIGEEYEDDARRALEVERDEKD